MLNRLKYCIMPLLPTAEKKITLTSTQLEWHALQPDTERFAHLFPQTLCNEKTCFSMLQPRLYDGLNLLLQTPARFPLLLVKNAESTEALQLLQKVLASLDDSPSATLYGGHYQTESDEISWRAAQSIGDNFASQGGIFAADWVESEQLFGCVRIHQSKLTLCPGLVHRANGGVLLLSLRTLLAQPLLWVRLKEIVVSQRFTWYSPDETRPLPLTIPAMPLKLRLVLTGDRDALAEFQEIEPELASAALYSEFEDQLRLDDEDDVSHWLNWTQWIADCLNCPPPAADFWPVLMHEAARYTGDQESLPLDPSWLSQQLLESQLLSDRATLSGENLQQALANRIWRESFLSERVLDDILTEQVRIETAGERIGQINALSVIEFPGHPRAFGEPSRISCVVHPGDGELTDVERKAELGGNIHAKGMMIMQSWLISELELDHPLPFSASVVFEQSYNEVDGDSASLAELCVLVSALASQPVFQHIAVTGSVDQFGQVQPVGGLNEKIEGFFAVCDHRGLSGNQGVILPLANVRHLALSAEVIDAVRNNQFHLWAVSSVEEALPLLTGVEWSKENQPCLLHSIQERITQLNQQEARHRPWPLRWLNWFLPG